MGNNLRLCRCKEATAVTRVWDLCLLEHVREALRVRRLRNELSSKLCIPYALPLVMLLSNFRFSPLSFSLSILSLSSVCLLYYNFLVSLLKSLFLLLIPCHSLLILFFFVFAMFPPFLRSFYLFGLQVEARNTSSFFVQASLCLKYSSQQCPAELERCSPAGAMKRRRSFRDALLKWTLRAATEAWRENSQLGEELSRCTTLFHIFHNFLPDDTEICAYISKDSAEMKIFDIYNVDIRFENSFYWKNKTD